MTPVEMLLSYVLVSHIIMLFCSEVVSHVMTLFAQATSSPILMLFTYFAVFHFVIFFLWVAMSLPVISSIQFYNSSGILLQTNASKLLSKLYANILYPLNTLILHTVLN